MDDLARIALRDHRGACAKYSVENLAVQQLCALLGRQEQLVRADRGQLTLYTKITDGLISVALAIPAISAPES